MTTWHIITGEYPPAIGGVSDYSQLVAEGLAAAGDEVHVWCPPGPGATPSNGVTVHPALGTISRSDLRGVDRLLDRFSGPRRLLVQWVPHGFGYRSMNLGFCLWLRQRAHAGDRVEIMVHEPYLAFGEGAIRWTAAAAVHRVMTTILARAAARIWIAIPAWERRWRPYTLGKNVPFVWLPIPTSLPTPNRDDVRRVRERYGLPGGAIVGHLGSYGGETTRMLSASIPAILERSTDTVAVLIGKNGRESCDQIARSRRDLAARVQATGALSSEELAQHVSACDVLVQPYPDGISSRRTSAIAGIALGVPVVTTTGHLTESFWADTESVSLTPAGEARQLASEALRLLTDECARQNLRARGRDLYARQFDVRHTISALRGTAQSPGLSPS